MRWIDRVLLAIAGQDARFEQELARLDLNLNRLMELHDTNESRLRARIEVLNAKIDRQKLALQDLNECARVRNLELDANHHVWCDGGCSGGVHRWGALRHQPLTPEIVEAAERGVKRMRTWLASAECKRRNDEERATK